MTVAIPTTNTTNTFDYWRQVTNQMANAMSTVMVSVNSNTAVGNATINGVFTANSVNSTAFVISNTSSAVTTITAPSAAQVANGQFYLTSNGQWAYIGGNPTLMTNTSGTSTVNVDSIVMATTTAAKYFLSVIDNTANNRYITSIVLTHDGTNPYYMEYATIATNSSIGVFSATANATVASLTFTPTSTNTTIKFSKTSQ